MTKERVRDTAALITAVLGGIIILYLLLKYIVGMLLPFLIAWWIAFIMRPPSAYLARRLGVGVRIVRPVLTLLASASILAALGIAVYFISREAWMMVTKFGEGEELKLFIDGIFREGGLPDRIFGALGGTVTEGIYTAVSSLFGNLLSAVSAIASGIPRAFLFVVITLIATLYFAIDLERINAAVLSIMPKTWCVALVRFKNGLVRASARYLKSYLLLFLITFGIMLFGLCVIGMPYALLLSLVTAALDLLPVIGVGTVLLPLAAVNLALGRGEMAIGLVVLFIVAAVVREIAEPKILGKSLGIHPIVTLLLLYVGYAIFGIVGVFLVPIVTVVIEPLINKENTAEVDEGSFGK